MASTYSTNLGIELIGTGEQDGTWGITTNTNLGTLIEQAISGYTTYACTGGTDTITIPNGASGTARNMFLELTGSGGGTLVVPANRKLYFIYNNTSGAITVKVSGQTGVSVPVGAKTILVSNGTDTVPAVNYAPSLTLGSALPIASGGTGQVIANNAFNALAPSQSGASGKYLKSNGTDTSWDAIDLSTSDVSGILALANGGTGSSSASGARSNLGLGSMATQNSTSVSITGGAISGITDLAIADGGTGASTAAGALSNLGAYPASNPSGYTSNTGTVTSVSGTGSYGGLSLSGSVTTSGSLTFGGTPSGTWPISITGSASSATTATNATNATNATYASNPASGGSFITSSNIGSQSVNYASSAGTASSATNATNATNATSASYSTTQPTGTNNTTIATTAFVQNTLQTVGAVGSLAFLYYPNNVTAGSTYSSAGGLAYSGMGYDVDAGRWIATTGASGVTGTWKALGTVTGDSAGSVTLFVRVS